MIYLKILDHDYSNKHYTTKELHKLTTENFATRLKQAKLATKAAIDDLVEKIDFGNKLKNLHKY